MPRKKEPNNAVRRKLLDISIHLFADRGKDSVGIREIASKGGITLNTVMYHFKSKDNLYLEATEKCLENVFNHKEVILCNATPETPQQAADELQIIVEQLFNLSENETSITQGKMMLRGIISNDIQVHKAVKNACNELQESFADLVSKLGGKSDKDTTKKICKVLINALLMHINSLEFCQNTREANMTKINVHQTLASQICSSIGLPSPKA